MSACMRSESLDVRTLKLAVSGVDGMAGERYVVKKRGLRTGRDTRRAGGIYDSRRRRI